MPYTTKMYVTEINKDFKGDALFPKIDLNEWKETKREKAQVDEKSKLEYDYVIYERKK